MMKPVKLKFVKVTAAARLGQVLKFVKTAGFQSLA